MHESGAFADNVLYYVLNFVLFKVLHACPDQVSSSGSVRLLETKNMGVFNRKTCMTAESN